MIDSIGQRIALNDGNTMPGYGFGTYKADGQELPGGIATAWQCGYRLFDTAAFYGQEDIVGEGLKNYPLDEYFLISKIWPTAFDNPVKALDACLKLLKRDYLDGYLLHWPGKVEKARLGAWEKLLRCREEGKIRSLGVSNFLKVHLEEIAANFGACPAMNQIECHPVFSQPELCEFCREKHIAVMAWSPLGRGRNLNSETIVNIAKALRKTPAQVVLRWHVQEGRIAIPKSVHAERIRENAEIFDFALDGTQLKALDALDEGVKGRAGADPMTFAG